MGMEEWQGVSWRHGPQHPNVFLARTRNAVTSLCNGPPGFIARSIAGSIYAPGKKQKPSVGRECRTNEPRAGKEVIRPSAKQPDRSTPTTQEYTLTAPRVCAGTSFAASCRCSAFASSLSGALRLSPAREAAWSTEQITGSAERVRERDRE